MKRVILVALGALAGGCAHHDASSDPNVAANAAVRPSYDHTGSPNAMPEATPAPSNDEGAPAPSAQVTPTPAPAAAPAPAPTTTAPPPATAPDASSGGVANANQNPNADNTGVNKRDKDAAHPTPMSQGNGSADIAITAAVRRAVMRDKAMSFTAKNVKIITNGGHVVLRGPVKSAEERAGIEAKARAVDGVLDVDNQLEIKP